MYLSKGIKDVLRTCIRVYIIILCVSDMIFAENTFKSLKMASIHSPLLKISEHIYIFKKIIIISFNAGHKMPFTSL